MRHHFRYFLYSTFLFVFLFFTSFSQAQDGPLQRGIPLPRPTIEYALPYPGILPDHTLYPIKVFRDSIVLFFTRDLVKRTHIQLLFADKKMSMGYVLWQRGKYELASEYFVKGERNMIEAITTLSMVKKTDAPPPGLADKIELALKKHDEVMSECLSQVPSGNAREELNEAIEINHQAMQQIPVLK
jgi:hypothetical protein